MAAAAPKWLARAKAQAPETTVQSLNANLLAVLTALRKAKNHRALSYNEIEQASGVSLADHPVLVDRLAENPKVVVHPGGSFAYNPVHKLANKADLLALVHATPEGLRSADIADSYETIQEDIDALVSSASVVALRSADNRGVVLFPRRGALLCRLSGTVSVEKGATVVTTSTDLTKEIGRGDVILINDVACRVATDTIDKPAGTHVDSRAGISFDTGAGLSASSTVPHKAKRQYRHVFTATQLPLQRKYTGETVREVEAWKHGFTNDVRDLWSGMVSDASWPKAGNWPALSDQMARENIGTDTSKKRFMGAGDRKGKKKRPRRRAPRNQLSAQMSYMAGSAAGKQLLRRMQRR